MADESSYPEMSALDKTPAVNAKQFTFAMQAAAAAFSYRLPVDFPENFGFRFRDEGGEERGYRLTDVPENRGFLAMRDVFEGDRAGFMASALRCFALMRIWKHERMSAFVRGGKDGIIEVNDAIFRAAAESPLNQDGDFDPDSFFARAAELAAVDEEGEEGL